MRTSISILFGAALLGASCAFTPQSVSLRPEVQVAPASVGHGATIAVTAVDERPHSTLGTRGVGGIGASLTLSQDLPSTVQAAVVDGLRRQGFNPISGKTPDSRELRVEIRNLDYTVTAGFWAGTLRTECSLKGICIFGDKRPYENLYRGEHQETVVVVQGASANEAYVNDALSKAIQGLLQDPELSKCLSQ